MEDGNTYSCIRPYCDCVVGALLENALLIQIIKAMQAQKASYPHDKSPTIFPDTDVSAAFLQAGLSCEQLREVLNASVVGSEQVLHDTRQRLNALCASCEVTKGIVNDYINRWALELLMFLFLPWGMPLVVLLLILTFSKRSRQICCGYYYHSGHSWYCCYSRCSTPSCYFKQARYGCWMLLLPIPELESGFTPALLLEPAKCCGPHGYCAILCSLSAVGDAGAVARYCSHHAANTKYCAVAQASSAGDPRR